jgi:hypothetical protein
MNARGVLSSVNLAAYRDGGWRHDGCGGRLSAYDIEVGR